MVRCPFYTTLYCSTAHVRTIYTLHCNILNYCTALYCDASCSQLSLIRTRAIQNFANSNKMFRSLENLLKKTSTIRISVIRAFADSSKIFRSVANLLTKGLCKSNFCNSNIFTMPQRLRIRQSRMYIKMRFSNDY